MAVNAEKDTVFGKIINPSSFSLYSGNLFIASIQYDGIALSKINTNIFLPVFDNLNKLLTFTF